MITPHKWGWGAGAAAVAFWGWAQGAAIAIPIPPSGGGGGYARWPQQPRYNDDEEVLMLVATAFMHILDMEGES